MITDAWQGACNARIVIRNTGAEVIDNWALTFTMGCDITNIWNAVVVDKESFLSGDGTDLFSYTIKNDHHNKDIPIGGQIELGMSLSIPANSGSFVLPDTYNMAQKEVAVPSDDYVFSSLIYGDTDYNYNGMFTLKNISETVIEDWSLEFTTDIDVIDFHTADLIERQGNHYIIKNRNYNSEIKPGEQIYIGFTANGTYGVPVTGTVIDTFMTDIRINENGDPASTVTEALTPVPTVTDEPRVTVTETPTETITPEPTITDVITPTGEIAPTEAVTPTEEITPTEMISGTPSVVITEEPTITPNVTPTENPTYEITPTITEAPPVTDTPVPTEIPDYTLEELYSDTDGDGLPLYIELGIGTNPDKPDTDGDGIPDSIELTNGMDPKVPDSDFESDKDFDQDGLADSDEISVYNTSAYLSDTDGDGLKDKFELEHSFDPLNPDTDGNGIIDGEEKIRQTVILYTDDLGYEYDDLCNRVGETIPLFKGEYVIPESFGAIKSVKVDLDIAGDVEDSVYIENMFGIHVFSSTFSARVGVPFDISVEKEYENAVITFEYYEDKLGDVDENDLCMLWYDEEHQHFVILEDAIIDTEANTITCPADHFSIRMIALKSLILDLFNKSSEGKQIRSTLGIDDPHIDIQVAIDVGRDYFKNNTSLVINGFKRIARAKLEDDEIGLSSAFGYQVEVDDTEESITYTDGKKYSSHQRFMSFTKSYASLRDFLDKIQPRDQYATIMQELEGMKSFFQNCSTETKDNKVVIWVSNSYLIADQTQQRQELVNELKDSGICIYQLYTGNEIDGILLANITESIEDCGGKFYTIRNEGMVKSALDSIRNELASEYPNYEIMFLFNPGQACYKTDSEKMAKIIAAIGENIDLFGPEISIGLMEIYRSEEEGEYSIPTTNDNRTTVWRYKVENSTFDANKNSFFEKLYKIKAEEGTCDYDFMRRSLHDNFFSVDNVSQNKKKLILVSDEKLTQFNKIKSFKDDGIELYYIYVGPSLDSVTRGALMRNIRDTGGEVYFVEKPSDFDDAISMILTMALGVADTKDSDGDGIPDCTELTGMILPDGTIVYTDPYNSDTDGDGLDDGLEMGMDRQIFRGVIDEDNGRISYFENTMLLSFNSYNVRSHPLCDDFDNDGYSDYDEARLYYSDGFNSDVRIVQLLDFDKYVSIDTSAEYVHDPKTGAKINLDNDMYGGNQEWFYSKNPIDGIDDLQSKQLSNGCGVIAAADYLLYLQKYNRYFKNLQLTPVDTSKEQISFNEYNDYVRWLEKNYVNLMDVESTVISLLHMIINDKIISEYYGITISDAITKKSGTWGVVPTTIARNLNSYLEDKNISNFIFTCDSQNYNYTDIESKICSSLRKNYPVLLHIVGKTNYKYIIPSSNRTGSVGLHNVNIVKIEQDKILKKTFVYCSSWSRLIKIDLQECWEAKAYADEVFGMGGHLDVSNLLSFFVNSRHTIMYLDRK